MPLLFILIPLAGVVFLNLPFVKGERKMAVRVAAGISLLQTLLSVLAGALAGTGIEQALDNMFAINLKITPFGALLLFLIGLVSLASFVTGASSVEMGRANFSSLTLLAVLGMNGVAMVDDLFSLYVFLEITAVSSFILIAQHRERGSLTSSFRYFVMSAVATVLMLSAVALVFMSAGSLGFGEIGRFSSNNGGVMSLPFVIAVVLFAAGLSIKAGIVPFHGWLPDAYASAPPAVSVLLAGIVTKVAGVYSLYKVFYIVFGKSPVMGDILMLAGTVSIVVGALAAIGQTDFKRMLAYSSISQVGYIILGIGVGTPLALLGAAFHFFNHSVFKSLLFVNSAAVEEKAGTRSLDRLGGLASRMPVTGGTSVVGFLSAAGIPPLSGFWSKLIIIIAVWQAGAYALSVIALLSGILTLGYFLILQRRVFFGETSEGLSKVTEAGAGFKVISLALSAITVLAGVLFPFVYTFFALDGFLH